MVLSPGGAAAVVAAGDLVLVGGGDRGEHQQRQPPSRAAVTGVRGLLAGLAGELGGMDGARQARNGMGMASSCRATNTVTSRGAMRLLRLSALAPYDVQVGAQRDGSAPGCVQERLQRVEPEQFMVPRSGHAVGSLPDAVVRFLANVGLDDDYLPFV